MSALTSLQSIGGHREENIELSFAGKLLSAYLHKLNKGKLLHGRCGVAMVEQVEGDLEEHV